MATNSLQLSGPLRLALPGMAQACVDGPAHQMRSCKQSVSVQPNVKIPNFLPGFLEAIGAGIDQSEQPSLNSSSHRLIRAAAQQPLINRNLPASRRHGEGRRNEGWAMIVVACSVLVEPAAASLEEGVREGLGGVRRSAAPACCTRA